MKNVPESILRRFMVSKDPVETEQGTFYKIIVSCPILTKRKPKAKS